MTAEARYWLIATLVILPITAVVLAAIRNAPYTLTEKLGATAVVLSFLYLMAALARL